MQIIYSMLLIFVFIYDCNGEDTEAKLLNHLLRDYNMYARPVRNKSQAINVALGLTLVKITELDTKKEILTTNMWLNYHWIDYNFRWNESEYDNIDSVRLPSSKVWTPDILMYNSNDKEIDTKFPTNVVVNSDGQCFWQPVGVFSTICRINTLWFPFDYQTCTSKFMSWTYDESKLNLTNMYDSIDLSFYESNGEWQLEDTSLTRVSLKYSCCPQTYPEILYQLVLRRISPYYIFLIIIPVVLFSGLALFTFIIPPDAGERISLSISIILSLGVLQLIVAENVPPTSVQVPFIMMYFLFVTFMSTISLMMTIVVLNFHFRTPDMYEMPNWIRRLFCEWLACLLRMPRPSHLQSCDKRRIREKTTENIESSSLFLDQDKENMSAAAMALDPLHNEMLAIMNELRVITRKVKNDDNTSSAINDWKFAAMVIDRACFWIFSTSLMVVVIIIIKTSYDKPSYT